MSYIGRANIKKRNIRHRTNHQKSAKERGGGVKKYSYFGMSFMNDP